MNENSGKARNKPDLASLFNSISAEENAKSEKTRQALNFSEQSLPTKIQDHSGKPVLPEEIADLLPLDLWRKVNVSQPRAGVLLNVLDRISSVYHTLCSFIPAHIVKEKLSNLIPGLTHGKIIQGGLLFADVSGFTALTEGFAEEGLAGAEKVTQIINHFFSDMIDVLSWSGGILLKFAGDALLVYYPYQENHAHIDWSIRSSLRLIKILDKYKQLDTPRGKHTLNMKISISEGEFLEASIGSIKRVEYFIQGEAVNQLMEGEAKASAGRIIISQPAAEQVSGKYLVKSLANGYFELSIDQLDDGDDFEIRPEKRRSRSSIPWSAETTELIGLINMKVSQINALKPYMAKVLFDEWVAHSNERRVQSAYLPVTVMFCNFWGAEELLSIWGQAGVHRISALLSAYFSAMSGIIEKFGGIVSRIDPYAHGSKMLALFGAPLSLEDAPQQAINAALMMNDELNEINTRWQKKLARQLDEKKQKLIQHRIGLCSGITFAGQAGSVMRREYTVMGDQVNLAARLMGAAQPGQILASLQLVERVKDNFYITQLPAIRVKGKSKPIAIAQIDGIRDDALLVRILSRDDIAGRQEELGRLNQIWQEIGSTGYLVHVVVGEAGMGKSHLSDYFINNLALEEAQLIAMQCKPYCLTQRYAGVINLAKLMIGIKTSDHEMIQADKINAFCKHFCVSETERKQLFAFFTLAYQPCVSGKALQDQKSDENDDFLALLKAEHRPQKRGITDQLERMGNDQDDLSVSAALNPQQTAGLFEQLLKIKSLDAPIIIYLDDSQYLDDDSMQLIVSKKSESEVGNVLVLMNSRVVPQGLPENHLTILAPLSKVETNEMVTGKLFSSLITLIHDQTQGHPLMVNELANWIKRTNKLDVNGIKDVLQSSNILQQLVLSLLMHVPENVRDVARVASIIGERFYFSEIIALIDNLDATILSKYLRELVQNQILAVDEMGIDAHYSFASPLIYRVLYNSLSVERRIKLHGNFCDHLAANQDERRAIKRKINQFLDTSAAITPLIHAQKLAFHLEQAAQYVSAAEKYLTIFALLDPSQTRKQEEALNAAIRNLEKSNSSKESADWIHLYLKAHLQLGDFFIREGEFEKASMMYETAYRQTGQKPDSEYAMIVAVKVFLLAIALGKDEAQTNVRTGLYSATMVDQSWQPSLAMLWESWRMQQCTFQESHQIQSMPPEVAGLFAEFSGDTSRAVNCYNQNGQQTLIALLNIQKGDLALATGDFEGASSIYQQAFKQFTGDIVGESYAAYRLAETAWQGNNANDALQWLEKSQSKIMNNQAGLQRACLNAINRAFDRIKREDHAPWSIQFQQPFDDHIRIPTMIALIKQV